MKTNRHLDSLLDAVRENPPAERLLHREEISSMLDEERQPHPLVPVPSTSNHWRLAMIIPSLLVLSGIAYIGLIGDGGDTAEPRTERPARDRVVMRADSARTIARTTPPGAESPGSEQSKREAHATRETARRTAEGARMTRSAESSGEIVERGRSMEGEGAMALDDPRERELDRAAALGAVAASTIDAAMRRGGDDAASEPLFLANSVAVDSNGTITLENVPEEEKPSIPSGGVVLVQTEYDSAEVAAMRANEPTDRKLDIGRLGYIELTPDEAAKLGIEMSETGLHFYADDMSAMTIRNRDRDEKIRLLDGQPDDMRLKRYTMTIRLEHSQFSSIELPEDAEPLAIAPVIVVNQHRTSLRKEGSSLIYFTDAPTLGHFDDRDLIGNGHYTMLYGASRANVEETDREAVRRHALLGRLVPVYFRFVGEKIEESDLDKVSEVCLWYAPTKEFLAALPERYRASLVSEIETIEEVVRERGTVEQACDRIAGKPSYLEVCRVSSGAVHAASASPNPAHGRTTVRFNLTEDRNVALTLHDMSGRYMRHLVYEEERAAGDHEIEADLAGVNQGAYLVAVRTDHGEQAVARLIVQ